MGIMTENCPHNLPPGCCAVCQSERIAAQNPPEFEHDTAPDPDTLLAEVLDFLEHAPFDSPRQGSMEIAEKIRRCLGMPTLQEEIEAWAAENKLPF